MSDDKQIEHEEFDQNMTKEEFIKFIEKYKVSGKESAFANDPESDTDSDIEAKKEKPIKTKWTKDLEILPDGSFRTPMILHIKLPNIQTEKSVECQDKESIP